MAVAGVLKTDQGIKDLNRVLAVAMERNEMFEEAVSELCSFFERHLKTQLLPFSASIEYPSSVQRQVYTFIDTYYRKFVDFMNSYDGVLSEAIADQVAQLFIEDREKLLAPIVATCFTRYRFFTNDSPILELPQFHDSVYQQLLDHIDELRDVALSVLTRAFPASSQSRTFTRLVETFIKLELSNSELLTLMEGFDAVLSRLDDKLIVYDFLYNNLVTESIVAFLCLPYLVEVSTTRAVDVENVYAHTFKSLTVEALSSPKRVKFLQTLSRILSSSKLPTNVPTAFAVKISRYLPLIPTDCQLDALSLLHTLVRAHESVAKLLEPMKTPVSDVDGDMEACKPQTLWEAISLRSSPVPVIADTASKLGQFHLPPEFGSFDLKSVVDSIKAKPKVASAQTGNWLSGLDRTVWTFH